jgi:hypothetical protein
MTVSPPRLDRDSTGVSDPVITSHTKEIGMSTIHHAARRLMWFTALGLVLALAATATVGAYPVTPEGDPLHAETVPTESFTGIPDSGSTPATPGNAVPLRKVASGGTDWSAVIAVAAASSLAALAVLAAASVLTGRRERSARVN